MDKRIIITIAKTVFFFGLIIWVYVIAMQIARPESVEWTFTRWFRLRMDEVGPIAFVGSVIGFFIWQHLSSKLKA